MKLNDDLPRSVSWVTRTIGYSVGLVIILALLVVIGRGRLANNTLDCVQEPHIFGPNQSALRNAQAMGTCLARRNGFLENLLMSSVHQTLRSLPNAPCEYVGIWNSFQPHCTYTVSLDATGEFTAEPLKCSISSDSISGSWGVHKNQMVWIYNQGRTWPPDINPIQRVDPNAFLLVEGNGSRTVYTRVAAIPSDLCPQ